MIKMKIKDEKRKRKRKRKEKYEVAYEEIRIKNLFTKIMTNEEQR